jgi:hypothetical protein
MGMQTTRRHAEWAAPLAWLRGRVTACGRGAVLGVNMEIPCALSSPKTSSC